MMIASRSALFGTFLGANVVAAQSSQSLRPMRVDDLLGMHQVHGGSIYSVARDGAIAIRVTRPRATMTNVVAGNGSDIWVQTAPGIPAINVTHGETDGSDWRGDPIVWSPDGQRLALLSTRGNLWRVWVWDRASRKLLPFASRVLQASHDFKHVQWLDNHSLLVAVPPAGAPVDSVGGTHGKAEWKVAQQGWATMLAGRVPSVSVVDAGVTGRGSPPVSAATGSVELLRVDVPSMTTTVVQPLYKTMWWLDRSVAAAPRGGMVAFLRESKAGTAATRSGEDRVFALELRDRNGQPLQLEGTLPADVVRNSLRWSLDGSALAVVSYGATRSVPLELWHVDVAGRRVRRARIGALVLPSPSGAGSVQLPQYEWTETGELVVLAGTSPDTSARRDWWLLSSTGAPVNLTKALAAVPQRLARAAGQHQLVGVADGEIVRLDVARRGATVLTSTYAPRVRGIVWPSEGPSWCVARILATADYPCPRPAAGVAGPGADVIVAIRADGATRDTYARFDVASGRATPLVPPRAEASFAGFVPATQTVIWHDPSGNDGSFVWRTAMSGGRSDTVLALDTWMSDIARPAPLRLFRYKMLTGELVRGGLVLPLGYRPGQRVPVIVDVYNAINVYPCTERDCAVGDGELLGPVGWRQIFAARGFAYVTVAMPLDKKQRAELGHGEMYAELPRGVLPAIDSLIAMGIADSTRLFLTGQSLGGYSVMGLISQTHRFKAGIARFGIADAISSDYVFDANSRYSDKPAAYGYFRYHGFPDLRVPPWEDVQRWIRNSPLLYANKIRTPLLLTTGEWDHAAPMVQSEMMFNALRQQGKRVQLARYWGEGHGPRSPANQRDEYYRTFAWFDEFGDIARDAEGNMIYENGRVKSRGGAPALTVEDFARFDSLNRPRAQP